MEEDDIKRTFIALFILREDSECCSKLKLEKNVLEAVNDEYDSDETVLCIENDESKRPTKNNPVQLIRGYGEHCFFLIKYVKNLKIIT